MDDSQSNKSALRLRGSAGGQLHWFSSISLPISLFLTIGISIASAQVTQSVVSVYPNTNYIQEIYYIREGKPDIKQGNYYTFYEGYLSSAKWNGGTIDADKIKGIKTRGYYKDNLKDSIWTVYNVPEPKSPEYNSIKEEGWYIEDKKAGIWYTFLEGGLVLKRYDFEEKKELDPLFKPKYIYPPRAMAEGLQGLVAVKIVYKNCKVSRYEIVKDIGYGCADAMIRALKQVEKLKPKYGVNPIDCSKKDQVITNLFRVK